MEGNTILIHRWMVTDYALKGIERDLYAIIYGFSQDGVSWCFSSLKYFEQMTLVSKKTIIRALASLIEKGLIEKDKNVINNVSMPKYRALQPKVFTYGQNDPTHGQNDPTYGQNDPTHGQNDPTYGQNDPYKRNIKEKEKKEENKYKESTNVDEKSGDFRPNEEPKTKNSFKSAIDYEAIKDFWNTTMKGKNIPAISKLTDARKIAIKARLKDYTLDEIHNAIIKVSQSDFCNGSTGWVANFDFVFTASKLIKIIEGAYDNRISAVNRSSIGQVLYDNSSEKYKNQKIKPW